MIWTDIEEHLEENHPESRLTVIARWVGVLRTIDNWHKHPWVSKIMCRMGRHDHEFFYMSDDTTARLQCFYCGRRKDSRTWLAKGQM